MTFKPISTHHERSGRHGRIYADPQWVQPDGKTWTPLADLVTQRPGHGWRVEIPGHPGWIELTPEQAGKLLAGRYQVESTKELVGGRGGTASDFISYLNWGHHLVNHNDHCNTYSMGTGWTCSPKDTQLIRNNQVSCISRKMLISHLVNNRLHGVSGMKSDPSNCSQGKHTCIRMGTKCV